VEYDDVINKHREVIYRRRREILLLAEKKTHP
jgi:preprotein translocase subunit SecA